MEQHLLNLSNYPKNLFCYCDKLKISANNAEKKSELKIMKTISQINKLIHKKNFNCKTYQFRSKYELLQVQQYCDSYNVTYEIGKDKNNMFNKLQSIVYHDSECCKQCDEYKFTYTKAPLFYIKIIKSSPDSHYSNHL